jgi:hypothetical protein
MWVKWSMRLQDAKGSCHLWSLDCTTLFPSLLALIRSSGYLLHLCVDLLIFWFFHCVNPVHAGTISILLAIVSPVLTKWLIHSRCSMNIFWCMERGSKLRNQSKWHTMLKELNVTGFSQLRSLLLLSDSACSISPTESLCGSVPICPVLSVPDTSFVSMEPSFVTHWRTGKSSLLCVLVGPMVLPYVPAQIQHHKLLFILPSICPSA